MTRSTTEAGGRGRWLVMNMIKNGSIAGTNNDGGGHEASGARREQVATRRLYKEQRAMSTKERLAIESVTNWKNFGRRLIKREEVDQEEDFIKPPQYTLSSRTRNVSSNFLNTSPTPALPLLSILLFDSFLPRTLNKPNRPTKASYRFKPYEKDAVGSCPVPHSLIMILLAQMRAVLAYLEDLPTYVASISTPSSHHTYRLHSTRVTLH